MHEFIASRVAGMHVAGNRVVIAITVDNQDEEFMAYVYSTNSPGDVS